MNAPQTLIALPLALAALALAGCNRNTAIGNDREAQLDHAPTPAPVMRAAAALENVAPALIKPETMSFADLAVLRPLAGDCAVRLTEVAFPSFVYTPGAAGTIKLNGKLIRLPATDDMRFSDQGLTVTLRPGQERGDAGLGEIDMIVVPPDADQETGYSGFNDCNIGESG
jgi:hypothetical protein